jgi:nucleotide-binding universal stress UspA family protein
VTGTVEPAGGPGLIVGYKGEAGSDVLVFAKRWVRASGEKVEVVTVYPGPAPIGPGRVDAEWVAYGREEAERLLAEAKAELTDAFPASYHSIGADSASHALHDLVEADPDTVVVLGSRKTRGLRRTSPGSTAERLLQGSTGPVALVPWDYESTEDHDLERVAVAFVDTPDGHAALPHASSLAPRLGATLTVLTVVPDTRVVPSFGDVRRFGAEQKAGYQAALDEALTTLPAEVKATGQLLDGSVVDALSDLTPDTVDLLICGSRGYGPARRVLLGGVSSRVLRHARVPVIVVPRG